MIPIEQALREARYERDEALQDARDSRVGELHAGDAAEEYRRERDEARTAAREAADYLYQQGDENAVSWAIYFRERYPWLRQEPREPPRPPKLEVEP
ncbi:MAG TPA: hypothetical protein VGP44_04405 [Gemmatimonadales bacterium]|nr:hypothetical protein [Gemmatimonadales bacterium]